MEKLDQETEIKNESGENGSDVVVDDKKPESKTFTQEQLDEIINKRLARAESKFNEKLTELTEAQKLQSMTEEERKSAEQEKLLAEYEELKAKNARYEMGRVATSLLSEHKVPVTEQVLDLVIGTDAESTKSNIEAFVNLVNETASKMVTEQLRGKTPQRTAANHLTKAEIFAIEDREKREAAIAKGIENGTI